MAFALSHKGLRRLTVAGDIIGGVLYSCKMSLSVLRRSQLVLAGTLIAAAPCQADDLQQQTKELQVLANRYRAAEGPKRAELEEQLRALIEQRAGALKEAMARQPDALLEWAVSRETAELLPQALQARLEHPATIEGVVDQAAESSAFGVMNIRDTQGRRLTVFCAGAPPPLVKGSTILVEGVQLDDHVAASCGAAEGVRARARSGAMTSPLAIAFRAPRQGSVVRGTVEVRAALPWAHPIAAIGLYRDGTLLQRRDSPPYAWSWQTRSEADGPHQLSLRAHDPDLNVGTAAITVTVDNTPPRIALAAPAPRSNLSGAVAFDAQAGDALGLDTVKFLVDGAAIGVAIQPPYSLRWDTASVPNGPHTIEAVAIDRAGNQTISAAVPVTVLNANTKPLLTPIGAKTVQEGVALSFSVEAFDPDTRGEALRYTASNVPPWATFDKVSHRFFGAPDFTVASSAEPSKVYPAVLFEVCDTQPSCAREAIGITVKNVNRPPVMSPIADREARENEPLTITPLISEPDGDPVTCTARLLPPWAVFDAKNCVIRGIPPLTTVTGARPTGVYKSIMIDACDPEEACVRQEFRITVKDAARASKLELIGDKTVEEGRPLRFPVAASDPDRDPVALAASGLPFGARFTDDGGGRGTFSWTPGENQAGAYEVVFEASDRTSTDVETITITVKEVSLTISGAVQNSLGDGFHGVTVEATNWKTFTRSAVTNADGTYLIRDIVPGSYRVRPVYSGGLNLPSNTGYSFEPFYRQIQITDKDQVLINFTAVQK